MTDCVTACSVANARSCVRMCAVLLTHSLVMCEHYECACVVIMHALYDLSECAECSVVE